MHSKADSIANKARKLELELARDVEIVSDLTGVPKSSIAPGFEIRRGRDDKKSLLEIIRKRGKKGITKSAIGQITRWINRGARSDYLADLVESDQIVVRQEARDRGAPKSTYYMPQFAPGSQFRVV